MVEDAKFEDAGDAPLALRAVDSDDLAVISALVQDAVFPGGEMNWDARRRRFAILLNRFRWEDNAAQAGRKFERVQSLLVVQDVLSVATQGVDRGDSDMIFSILSLVFAPGEDGMGRLELTLAGDGAIGLQLETLEVTLSDVTRPYVAPSGKAPSHD